MATKKMGRPIIDINWEDLEKLCILQCSLESCAIFFDCTTSALQKRIKKEYGTSFSAYRKQKAERGKKMLRQKQFETAMRGNVPMLIFLGKNWLGQTDKPELQTDTETPLPWVD